jgi:hypothetical protein
MGTRRENVLAERMRRQRIGRPARTPKEYEALFRLLQPVRPVHFTRPGDPPRLVHRASFDDGRLAGRWRGTREIVKGRFLRGNVGYVLGSELELYANAFQRPLTRLTRDQEAVLDAVTHAGPLTPRQLKEETGLLNRRGMPILHRLQQAFIVYEDQVDDDWERPWYAFGQEWPDVTVGPDRWESAAREVLLRFISSQVHVTAENVRDWSGWPAAGVRRLLGLLEADGRIVLRSVEDMGEGWMPAEDADLADGAPAPGAFMVHKSDPLVSCRTGELSRRFAGREVLQYLLIDGDILGAVCGHWRIGPHDVEDVVVLIRKAQRTARQAEILHAVAWGYQPPDHRILRYDGKPVKKSS